MIPMCTVGSAESVATTFTNVWEIVSVNEKSKNQNVAENSAPPKDKLTLLEFMPKHPAEALREQFSSFADKASGGDGVLTVYPSFVGGMVLNRLKRYAPHRIRLIFEGLDFIASVDNISEGVRIDLAERLDSGATVNETVKYAERIIENSSEEAKRKWANYRNATSGRWAKAGKRWPPSAGTE